MEVSVDECADLINQTNFPENLQEAAASNAKKRKRTASSADGVATNRPRSKHPARGRVTPSRGGPRPGVSRPRRRDTDIYELPNDRKIVETEDISEAAVVNKKQRGRPKRSGQQNKKPSRRKRAIKKDESEGVNEDEDEEGNEEESPTQDLAEAPSGNQGVATGKTISEDSDAGAVERDKAVRRGLPGQDRSSPASVQHQRITESADESQLPTEPGELLAKRLLGQEHLWEGILKALREQAKGTATTDAIKSIVAATNDATTLYRDIDRCRRDGNSPAVLEADVEPFLDDLQDHVENLSSGRNVNDTAKRVSDVYRKAVPQLGKLLSKAMNVRVLRNSRKAYDMEGIRQIIRIQETIILLCEKVAQWAVKPRGGAPFTRNIKQRVLPYLRKMVKAFKSELTNEERRERISKNRIASQQMQRQYTPPSPTEEDRQAAIEHQRREIQASIQEQKRADEKARRWNRLQRTQRTSTADPSPRPPEASQRAWTEEEDTALLIQLLSNKAIVRLPAQERYREILSHEPLLQNMLPEHIRDRALFLKPSLILSVKDSGGRVPKFVSSIE